ncbi:hypothetical protein JTB14_010274 [Gonioctena quinquepunctata]|nr:hypothetical protein JTB14_010274 [Gonioctena quinquepunctata]
MTSDDIVSKKINFKTPKTTPLRRSVSTTSLGLMFETHLTLRDTKSYTGGTEDVSSDEENEVKEDKIGELMTNIYSIKDEVETIDAATNEKYLVKTKILQKVDKNYSLNDLAYTWKKDCRLWLWKNCYEMKMNRSVAAKLKVELIKMKELKYHS